MANSSNSTDSSVWQRVGEMNRTLFEACIQHARRCGDQGQFEDAMAWCSVAAWSASGSGWFGQLSSRELETELIRAAEHLPVPPARPQPNQSRPRWLHVFTEAYATLGHTNLCRRWIQFDPDVIHDVILINQRGPAPENLVSAAKRSGGQCVILDATTPMLQRAAELRQYACANADVVVLHTHPDEVMAVVAFGIPAGPVVLFVNHADHVFWVGCAVADLVLEIRRSGQDWTRRLRGVTASEILPIPLEESAGGKKSTALQLEERKSLRAKLGIPENAVMLLTVGSAAKFEPMGELDFLKTAQQLLRETQDTYLVAVGPKDEGVWKAAKEAAGGRLLPVGYQLDSTAFCRAADLYLEGFPVGSLTALLEAGQAGLMFVRAPRQSPLPFCSDSVSIESVKQPADLLDYVNTAKTLIGDPSGRRTAGANLRNAIEQQHCDDGWLARLREIRANLPQTHRVSRDFKSVLAPSGHRDWFLAYSFRKGAQPTPEMLAKRVFMEAWKRTGESSPAVSPQVWTSLQRDHSDQTSRTGDSPETLALESGELQRINEKLASDGMLQRLLDRADVALRIGKAGLARRLVYQCFLKAPSCLADANWRKHFAKTHLGLTASAKLRKMLARGRRFS